MSGSRDTAALAGGVWVRRSDVHGVKPEPDAFRMVFAEDAERRVKEGLELAHEVEQQADASADYHELELLEVAKGIVANAGRVGARGAELELARAYLASHATNARGRRGARIPVSGSRDTAARLTPLNEQLERARLAKPDRIGAGHWQEWVAYAVTLDSALDEAEAEVVRLQQALDDLRREDG